MFQVEEFGGGQGWLKGGFLGFAGSGKTVTATKLAIGVRAAFGLEGPIAMFDTEGGSEYVAPTVLKATGKRLVGKRSRSLDDLIAMTNYCVANGVSVMIADSVTHVWREVCDAYLKQVNARRAKKNLGIQTKLEFQDWGPIKAKWTIWTDLYLNSPLHIVICGRAGYEYDFEQREDGSGKDLVKTGIKMKTEGEFGFEPSLLVEMERVQKVDPNGKLSKVFVRRATVLKDRFDVIDGEQADDPDYPFFAPHVQMLVPGAHAPVDTEARTDLAIGDDGDSAWKHEQRQRVILCEEIQGELLRAWPGQTAAEKASKAEAIEAAFGTRSWTKVESMNASRLADGLALIREKTTAQSGGEAA